ncbi:MAG: hypothetical protein M5U25_07155 [Planctomycetota bacterium]|nr:hypothetical protein [Planctomycetota bacterium]
MLRHQIFKSEEFRFTFEKMGAAAVTQALEKATNDATAWMNEHADKMTVKHVSTGLASIWAYVTVWYEMNDGS